MGKQGVILKDHANPPPFRGNPTAGTTGMMTRQLDMAALGLLKTSNQAEESSFAATRRPQQAQQLPLTQG